MNTKHTPGPWFVRFIGDENGDFFVEAKNNNMPELGYGIEVMMEDFGDHNGYPRDQRLADAKLIAAAPDLLEALQEAIATMSRCYTCVGGQSPVVTEELLIDLQQDIKNGRSAITKAIT